MKGKLVKNNKFLYSFVYILKYKICYPLNRIINRIKIILVLVFNINSRNDLDIQKIQNSKAGKSCIIVGNGPSVSIQDLDVIQKCGIDSFGANKIIDLCGETIWCPTYLSVCDTTFITGLNNSTDAKEYIEKIKEIGVSYCFFTNKMKRMVKNQLSNCLFLRLWTSKGYTKKLMKYSSNISKYISDLGSVTHFSIQIATYLGYKKIYLYGIDNTYKKYFNDAGEFIVENEIKSHANGISLLDTDKNTNSIPKNKFESYFIGGFFDERKSNIGYQMCKNYAISKNIEIVNITRGGRLNIFKRDKFENVFIN